MWDLAHSKLLALPRPHLAVSDDPPRRKRHARLLETEPRVQGPTVPHLPRRKPPRHLSIVPNRAACLAKDLLPALTVSARGMVRAAPQGIFPRERGHPSRNLPVPSAAKHDNALRRLLLPLR